MTDTTTDPPFEVRVAFRNGPLCSRIATAKVKAGTHVGEIVPVRRETFHRVLGRETLAYRIADSELNRAILRERGRFANLALGLVHVPYAEAFVLVHEEDGIFLGQGMGLGFWSKLDPVGQDAAVTFPTAAEFNDWIAEVRKENPDAFRQPSSLVRVKASKYEGGVWYATIDDCKAAGLPGWTPFPINPL